MITLEQLQQLVPKKSKVRLTEPDFGFFGGDTNWRAAEGNVYLVQEISDDRVNVAEGGLFLVPPAYLTLVSPETPLGPLCDCPWKDLDWRGNVAPWRVYCACGAREVYHAKKLPIREKTLADKELIGW